MVSFDSDKGDHFPLRWSPCRVLHEYPSQASEFGPTAQKQNDTFLIVTIGCALCAILTIFVGRDPVIEAAKRAKASGEEAVVEHVTLLTE